MKFRPFTTVRQLRTDSTTLYGFAIKAAYLAALIGYASLDQQGRPRGKKAKPTPGKKRVIRTRSAKDVWGTVCAHLRDRAEQKNLPNLSRKILNRVLKNGGLGAVADIPQSRDLIAQFLKNQKDVSYVNSIVHYLLRSHAYPEDGLPCTIEDAKGFVWNWNSEWGGSKIGQVWETYKLAAPYLYALSLEKSFRPLKTASLDDILDWTTSFAKSRRRIDRFLGRAAYAMDVLKTLADDQRERDFLDVARIAPPLRRFNDEEKRYSKNVDRTEERYGRSFRDLTSHMKRRLSALPESKAIS